MSYNDRNDRSNGDRPGRGRHGGQRSHKFDYGNRDGSQYHANLDLRHIPSRRFDHDDTKPIPPKYHWPSGWDLQGTAEDIDYVTKYITANALGRPAPAEPASAVSDPNNINMAVLGALLPSHIASSSTLQQPPSSSSQVDPVLASLLPAHMLPSIGLAPPGSATSQQQSSSSSSSSGSTTAAHDPYGAVNFASKNPFHPLLEAARPRVYVGHIPLVEARLLEAEFPRVIFENLQLLVDKPKPALNPYNEKTAITNILIHQSGKFAFVEFGSLIDAAAALSLDGLQVTLNLPYPTPYTFLVRSPNDMGTYYQHFPPTYFRHSTAPTNYDRLVSGQGPAGSNHNNNNMNRTSMTGGNTSSNDPNKMSIKVYIGNISQIITRDTLYTLVSSALGMPPLSLHLTAKADQPGKVFAFVEVPTLELAQQLIGCLDGQTIEGRSLSVKISMSDQQSGYTAQLQEQLQQQQQQQQQRSLNTNLAKQGFRIPISIADFPTQYLCFANVCSYEEYQTEGSEILDDLIQGITRRPNVSILASKVSQNGNYNSCDDVLFFFQFNDPLQSSDILTVFNGKAFGDRKLIVHFIYDEYWNTIK